MFFLGDQPLILPQTIQQLQQSWQQQTECILVPTYQGKRGNPVLFPAWAFAEMAQLGADEGARGLLTRYAEQVHFKAVDDEGILLDLDTPAAYEAALTVWQKRDNEKMK